MVNNGVAVEVTDLHVRRGGREVLPSLSCSLNRGEITGLLGPSGCGKSTLIRSIVGVQKVVSGTVTVLGQPAGSASLRHRVGYVTQAPSVYSNLSVADNVAFFARVLGAPRDEVDEVIERVGLSSHRTSLAGNLSGGQLSRASLAVALLGNPPVLLLDEPTVGLDPVLRVELWGMFRGLAQDGTTLLVSSHVMDEAILCGQLLLMREGQVLAADTPQGLMHQAGTDNVGDAFLDLVRHAERTSS
ncbi:MAG: ABC transporter ATP-binding protein [Ornithinimicrobium sp.]